MATATTPRKPYQATEPAHGVCRWCFAPDAAGKGWAVINAADYIVTPIDTTGSFVRRAWELENLENANRYHVAEHTDGRFACDCADATYHPERPGGCKHAKALRLLLAAVGKL